jgi:hypothetical protein
LACCNTSGQELRYALVVTQSHCVKSNYNHLPRLSLCSAHFLLRIASLFRWRSFSDSVLASSCALALPIFSLDFTASKLPRFAFATPQQVQLWDCGQLSGSHRSLLVGGRTIPGLNTRSTNPLVSVLKSNLSENFRLSHPCSPSSTPSSP